jgi:hypothetical protein
MHSIRIALLMLVVVAACSAKEKRDESSSSGSATPSASQAKQPQAKQPEAKPPDAGGSELFHTGDPAASETFGDGALAIGGGYVYWVNQPRIDKAGLGKTIVERKPAAGGQVETVVAPTQVLRIAADRDALYWAGKGAVWSRPHAGGEPKQLVKGTFFEVVPGSSYLLVRGAKLMGLVPKTGGPIEKLWNGNHSGGVQIAADGDRFYVIEAARGGAGTLTAYEHGKPPLKLVEGTARGEVGVHGAFVYFGGPGTTAVSPSLWRVEKTKGGAPEQVGQMKWGFGRFIIQGGALYGMVFNRKWHVQKLPLEAPPQEPILLDSLAGFGSMVASFAADDRHLYFLTRVDVKRVPL